MGGYTRVDNWLFDVVMPKASPNAYKVVSVVVRKTAGWNKAADRISYSEFQRLAGIAGRDTVANAINEALDCGWIVRQKEGQAYIYRASMIFIPEQDNQYENHTSDQYENHTETSMKIIHTKEKKQKDKEAPPETYSNGQGPIKELSDHFTDVAGILPNLGVYAKKWEKPLQLILDNAGSVEVAKQRITSAVDFARTGEKKYTISSPHSLLVIISNNPGQETGSIKVRTR